MGSKLSTAELIAGIRNDVIEARYFFEVYSTYRLKETREKYSSVFVFHGDFIASDQRANFAAMMVTLGRIFDRNPKNLGIPALLKADPELKAVGKQKYERIVELRADEKVQVLRHQIVAHRPSSRTVPETFEFVKPSLDKLRELIELLDQLIDAWSREARCHVHIGSRMEPHIVSVLNALLRDVEARTGGGFQTRITVIEEKPQ